ncbi:hypothetical protein LJR225_003443 [Phenylobacterium sp. LjRoot225]|uniref:hypothetical protein n=1 Tax=Phenylobacterium sp. LjRoot225 TaxID=3342285 RepID=UPI003ECD26C1
MPTTDTKTGRKIYVGSASPGANTWKPGGLAESSRIRSEGTTGPLKIGFWRTHALAYRCQPNGSCLAAGNAPSHDAVLVLEGSGTITIPSTGRQIQIEPGLIVSHPQGIKVQWDIDAPYLKKLFIEWDRSDAPKNIGDVHIAHVTDNPDSWKRSEWTEPSKGIQKYGEAYLIRQDGAPDTALVGVWRGGCGIAGASSRNPEPVLYSGGRGDTSIFLLEGRAKVENHETGDTHEFKSGDVIGLSEGLPISWTNQTPFVKTFFVVTKKTSQT